MGAPKTERVRTNPDEVTPVEAEKVSDINLNNVGRFKKTTTEMEADADQAQAVLAGEPFDPLKMLGIDFSDGVSTNELIALGAAGAVTALVLAIFFGRTHITPPRIAR